MIKFIVNILGNFLTILGIGIATFTYTPILYSELMYRTMGPYEEPTYNENESNKVTVKEDENKNEPEYENIVLLEPDNEQFAILIPKIGVNAPIVQDVTTSNQIEYMQALREGVAHAKGTSKPGENGNIFLFAHSSLNFWQLGPYATVFNLLNKLETNDTVTLVYDGRHYVYRVYEMDVVPGWDTSPFEEEYDESIVTMITCDPPGTTINRRVIKAKLVFEGV